MFANHELVTIDLWLLKLEIYWGWENGEGRLGLNVLDSSMLKEWESITIFQLTVWVLSVSLFLELGSLTQRKPFSVPALGAKAVMAILAKWSDEIFKRIKTTSEEA